MFFNVYIFIFCVFQGLAITFASDEADAKVLNNVQDRFDVNITELPDEIDLSSYSKLLNIFIIKTLEGLSWRVFVGSGQISHTFTS